MARKTEVEGIAPTLQHIEQSEAASTSYEDMGSILSDITIAQADTLRRDKDYLDLLKFDMEPVEVLIHQSNNPNDTARMLSIAINGVDHYFIRGEWTKTKRYIVSWLADARAEEWDFGYRKSYDGVVSETSTVQKRLLHPFSVRGDTPKGEAWLRDKLKI